MAAKTSVAVSWLAKPKEQQQPKQETPYVPLTDRYALVERIGDSSEGIVDLARSVTTGELRVMKIVKANRPEYPREARMLRAVGKHPNVLRFFEAEHYPLRDVTIMCMEYYRMGDLYALQHHLHERKLRTPAGLALQAIVNISEGLAFIHGGWVRDVNSDQYRLTVQEHLNMVNRDIKPCNIFIRPSADGKHLPTFVIGDFGQAFDPTAVANYEGGTPGFRAPEFYSFNKPPLTAKADVYSFGTTMVSLCRGLAAGIHGCGEPADKLLLPHHLSNFGMQALLRRCLAFAPRDRPDMSPGGALWYVPGFRNHLEGMKDEIALTLHVWLPGF